MGSLAFVDKGDSETVTLCTPRLNKKCIMTNVTVSDIVVAQLLYYQRVNDRHILISAINKLNITLKEQCLSSDSE